METNNIHHLRRQVANLRQSLFDQGYVDEQFIELEELQDDATPNFVEEVVTLFCKDSARLIHIIDQTLENHPVDFAKLDNYMHQFKGSSSSIGAKKVKTKCTQFMEYCRAENVEGQRSRRQSMGRSIVRLFDRFMLLVVCGKEQSRSPRRLAIEEINWAELQHDLLALIARRLNMIKDYFNFDTVCKSWPSVATKNYFNSGLPRVPWLILAEKEDNEENSLRRFFSLSNGTILNKRILKASRKRCMESMGWLITVGEDDYEVGVYRSNRQVKSNRRIESN
ncbi:Histidine-containing phosphotransfer protein 1 [Capsicum annuum]|nr:Histidine-containing phosphotransfer protein 1 [Capsicum annuum]